MRQKLQFMRQELREPKRFQGMDLSQFKSNRLYEAAATRMLQVTIEAAGFRPLKTDLPPFCPP